MTLFEDSSGVPRHATSTPNQSAVSHAMTISASGRRSDQYCVNERRAELNRLGFRGRHGLDPSVLLLFFFGFEKRIQYPWFHSLVNHRCSLYKNHTEKHHKIARSTEYTVSVWCYVLVTYGDQSYVKRWAARSCCAASDVRQFSMCHTESR
jgi:hypothetical protein